MSDTSESLAVLQRRLGEAYADGAPGVLVSGMVWLAAGIVARSQGISSGFTALFIGGMLIQPLSVLVARAGFRTPKATAPNPLERTAIESTFALFAGLFVAYLLLRTAPALVFPVVALAIGTRYFVFRTLYGNAVFWALGGAILIVATVAALGLALPGAICAIAVGAVEIGFAILILVRRRP